MPYSRRQHKTCLEFLERGARSNLALHITVPIGAEVIHRAMILDAIAQGIATRSSDAVTHLKHYPEAVKLLTRYKSILRDLTQSRINILPVTYRDLHSSKQFREDYGLLTNDSLTLAFMLRESIQFLATNDADFERIPNIAVRLPD